MPDITERFYQAASTTELGKLLTEYLAQRKRLPEVRQKVLPEDTNARYEYNTVFGSDLPSEGVISVQPSWTPAQTGTAVHEITHAAQRELAEQFFATPREARASDQYAQAFRKLQLSGKDGGATLLAERLAPEWRRENREYRASPAELTAFAAGNMSGARVRPGPPHLDATLAQELSILADLASRRKAK